MSLDGVPRHRDDVGEVAGGQPAQFVVGLDQLGADDRRRAKRLHRRHPPRHQRAQLLGVLAVRYRGRVGAAGDPDTRGDRLGQHRLGPREDVLGLLAQLRGDAVDRHRLGEVGGRHQERAVVDHHLNRLVGGEEAVFDAVDTGPDACPNRAVPDRMCGHPHTGPVCLVGDRGELVVGVLLRSRCGAVRHHPARGRHLDQLGAVPDLIAHAGPNLVDRRWRFPRRPTAA